MMPMIETLPVGSDTLTILTSSGPRLTKVWDSAAGKVLGYEKARQVSVQERVVAGIRDLSSLLRDLEGEANSCIVRGKFVGHTEAKRRYQDILAADAKRNASAVTTLPKDGFTLRRAELFPDQPLHYFMIDIDHFFPTGVDPVLAPEEAIEQYILDKLPLPFHGVTFHWQLSSGAGHPDNAGMLKAHVWFWLKTPYVGDDLTLWAQNTNLGLDVSVFRQVQPNYTAAPVFRNDAIDPVPVRSGLWEGWLDDEVDLTIDPALLVKARKERKERREMVDPREKAGLIGLFHRLFSIEDVVDRWLPDVFEFVTEQRLNFLQSESGAVEGVGVCDHRQGLFNTHSGDPFKGRAANKWDLVRHYKFGHLDEGMDEGEKALLGPAGWPSHMAMIEMVESLPEVLEELRKEHQVTYASWADKIKSVDNDHDLQHMIEAEIAFDRDLTTIDLAKLEGEIKAKFTELGVTLPVATIRKMLKKRNSRPLPDINSEGRPMETEDNLRVICENNDVIVRYNVVKKEDEILIPGATWSIDNRRSASLTWLRGQCHKSEMGTKYLKNFVTLLADKNLYNPVAEWISSQPWDGESRVQAWYDTVVENAEECDKTVKEMIMRRWAMSAIAAAFQPNGVMARGVLVLQGDQYLGKTRWLESLAPKELELVKTGRSLNVHDKDSVKQILSCWIGELGELDSTFKKSDIAALKAFITQNTDEMRRPYAEAESQFARRTVFAGSVNDKEFLQDQTGNSRFWTIPIVAVRHDHGLNMQQVWAELYEIWKQGELHYLTHTEMAQLNDHNCIFEAVSPIAELIANHLDWESFAPDNCKWMGASDVLRWLGSHAPTKWEATEAGRAISERNGGLRKRTGKHRYLAVPVRKKHIGGDFDDGYAEF